MSEIKKDKVLLTYVSDKNELLLDGYDLVKTADMYDLSVHRFFEILPKFLYMYQDKKCEVIQTINVDPQANKLSTKSELSTALENYEDLKRKIFGFAYLACSDKADEHFYDWGAEGCLEYITLGISQTLIKEGKIHAIYRSTHGGYNIKISTHTASEEDVKKAYSLLKK